MCRSRRELSNAYLLAKIGVDTAENEPLEVLGGKFNSLFTSLLRPRPSGAARNAARGGAADGEEATGGSGGRERERENEDRSNLGGGRGIF